MSIINKRYMKRINIPRNLKDFNILSKYYLKLSTEVILVYVLI